MPTRVLIADDQPLVLKRVRNVLASAADIEVVGSTQRGDQIVPLVERHRPDLVLLDHTMAGAAALCVRRIKRGRPEVMVVVLSSSEDAAKIDEALRAGADAYIAKRINPEDLASALRQVVARVVYLPAPGRVPVAASAPDAEPLTERELTMLEAISRGLSTKMISRELWISEKTVKFHLTNIYRKLGVHNRAGAMRYAFQHGLAGQAVVAKLAATAG